MPYSISFIKPAHCVKKEIPKMIERRMDVEYAYGSTRFLAKKLTAEAVSVFTFCMANPIDYLEAAEYKDERGFRQDPLMVSFNGRHKWALDRAISLEHYLEEGRDLKVHRERVWLETQLAKIYNPLKKIIEEIRKVNTGFSLRSIDPESDLPAGFVPEEQNSEFTPDFSLDERLASCYSPGVTTMVRRLFLKLLEKQESLLKIRG